MKLRMKQDQRFARYLIRRWLKKPNSEPSISNTRVKSLFNKMLKVNLKKMLTITDTYQL